MQLDKTDRIILFELDRNCRQSNRRIAEKHKIKTDTVNFRIKRLEKQEIIKDYHTVIDYSKLGYILIRVYLKLQNTTPEIEEKIVQHMKNTKNVMALFWTQGNYDITSGYIVKSFDEFKSIFQNLKEKFGAYINNDQTSVLYEYVHYFRNYLVEEKKRDYSVCRTGNSAPVTLDPADYQILKILAYNAKTPLLDIALQLGLTSSAIKHRVKKLQEKQVIQAYRAGIDYRALGMTRYKIDFIIEDFSKIKKMEDYAKTNEHILYMDKTIGGSDFEIDIEVPTQAGLNDFLQQIKKQFPSAIRTYNYYRAIKNQKILYYPD